MSLSSHGTVNIKLTIWPVVCLHRHRFSLLIVFDNPVVHVAWKCYSSLNVYFVAHSLHIDQLAAVQSTNWELAQS